VAVTNLFHIGINALIDHENADNLWLEKVFYFYCLNEPYDINPDLEPDVKVRVKTMDKYDGMEFVQFYIFVKDGDSRLRANKVECFKIYEEMCTQKHRQRLSCNDFCELIRMNDLIK